MCVLLSLTWNHQRIYPYCRAHARTHAETRSSSLTGWCRLSNCYIIELTHNDRVFPPTGTEHPYLVNGTSAAVTGNAKFGLKLCYFSWLARSDSDFTSLLPSTLFLLAVWTANFHSHLHFWGQYSVILTCKLRLAEALYKTNIFMLYMLYKLINSTILPPIACHHLLTKWL